MCVFCSLSYPAATEHAHRHLRSARLYKIFLRYVINGKIFEKKVLKQKTSVMIFSTTLSQIFLILRRNERDMIKNAYWCSRNVAVILAKL